MWCSIGSRALPLTVVACLCAVTFGCDSKSSDDEQKAAKAADAPKDADAAKTADAATAADDEATPEASAGSAAAKGDDGDAKPAAPKGPKLDAPVELERVEDKQLGYSILLPKGAKALQKDPLAHTYSLVFEGEMYELHTHITTWKHDDLAGLQKQVEDMYGEKVATAEELADEGLLRVIGEPREIFGVKVFVAVKGKELDVRCSGPESRRDDLIEICSSIRALE